MKGIIINGVTYEEVAEFICLGTLNCIDNSVEKEIPKRIDVECRINLWFRLMGRSARKGDDVTALPSPRPSRHKMADMCYYGNVMTTKRWWLCVTMETLFFIFNSTVID